MNKKSQALIISLWILAILTVMAVGIGHRVAMSLRMSRYGRDSLQALYQAKAQVSLAISRISADTSVGYDSMLDEWMTSIEPALCRISDDDRLLNLNEAPAGLLTELFEQSGVAVTVDLVNNLLIWRGDAQDSVKAYESLGYSPKGADFACVEELAMVKDLTAEDYSKVKDYVTVYAKKTNINTASQEVLSMIMRSQASFLSANGVSVTPADADSLTQKIVFWRNGPDNIASSADDRVFTDTASIAAGLALTAGNEQQILQQAVQNNLIGVKSDFIRIIAFGRANRVTRSVEAVYDRLKAKVVFWHEN
jgi:type II secretory pathway component PulK